VASCSLRVATCRRDHCGNLPLVAVEREIRFLVTEGTPPPGGREMVQGYLLRGSVSARVRLIEGREAWLTLKVPSREGRREWERRVPLWLARPLLSLRLPRVEKLRAVDGDLEIDRYTWPPGLVVVECELAEGSGPPLGDREACSAWMEARRPGWVKAWRDVTSDPSMTAARLARRKG
jgi:CYTH domain-containing protein